MIDKSKMRKVIVWLGLLTTAAVGRLWLRGALKRILSVERSRRLRSASLAAAPCAADCVRIVPADPTGRLANRRSSRECRQLAGSVHAARPINCGGPLAGP